MANVQKSASGTEANMDALGLIVSKALGYPIVGTHVGGGLHVSMPATWDGQGACPPGWTKVAVSTWVASASSAALPISDAMATQLQSAPALSRLTPGEQGQLTAALSGRGNVDLEAGAFTPKPIP